MATNDLLDQIQRMLGSTKQIKQDEYNRLYLLAVMSLVSGQEELKKTLLEHADKIEINRKNNIVLWVKDNKALAIILTSLGVVVINVLASQPIRVLVIFALKSIGIDITSFIL